MRILAIESSAAVASVALTDKYGKMVERNIHGANTHSETLLPMVETLTAICGCEVADVDLFACAVGPGSFTGVRIGVATLKGLAFGSGKPCVGVSSLEALAYNLREAARDGERICPVLNARRTQVYNAVFTFKKGVLCRLCPDRLILIDDLAKELCEGDGDVRFCGDACEESVAAAKAAGVRIRATPRALTDPSASSVAFCALHAYHAGTVTTDADLAPVYLRPCQAERDRLEALEKGKDGQEKS